jgi:hypothetical protein
MQTISTIDEISLVGPISAAVLRDLPRETAIGTLSLTPEKAKPYKMRTLAEKAAKPRRAYFTEAIARGLAGIHALDKLWLWLDATPAALRHVFAIPGLRVLDLLGLAHPGRLAGFAATKIEEFRCNTGLRELDLLEISASTSLKQFGAQSSELSIRAMTALIAMPQLQSLDIEGTSFDDAMAELLIDNHSLHSLEVGMTRLSGKGLAHLRTMKNLRSLDLWATRITEDDLDLLAGMPLEYLSIGRVDDENFASFSVDIVMKKLAALPSLKRIWLDGLDLNAGHLAEFKRRKITVRQ